MREVAASKITDMVRELFIQANYQLPADIEACMRSAQQKEQSPQGKAALKGLVENIDASKRLNVPLCQDTGMAVVFLEVGQEVHITGGALREAVDEGVRRAYHDGYLRCSVVADPIRRGNTNDNTPAILYTEIVPGDQIHILAAPKGFGSENMSRSRMFTPAAGKEEILAFIAACVKEAASNPCPPVVVGVGIGGSFEYSALLAKKALCRSIAAANADPYYAAMEKEALQLVNRTGVGPQGFGGTMTALAVNIEQYPTHIAGLPVAVNMGCHVTRHAAGTI